jgi:hypothetical protein
MVDNIIKLGFNFLFGIASVFGIGYVYSCIKNIDYQTYEDNRVKHDYILELIKKTYIIIEQNEKIINENEKILLRLNTITDSLHFNNKIITEQYENIQNIMLKLIIDNPPTPKYKKDTLDCEKEEYDIIQNNKSTKTSSSNIAFTTNSSKGIFGLF